MATTQALTRNSFRITAGDSMYRGNIEQGGQYGFIGHLNRIDAVTPLVMNPAIGIITSVPKIFRLIPGYPQFCKALFEVNTIGIDGIDVECNIEPGQAPASPDGQQINVPMANKRTQPTPTFRFVETTGNPVWGFINNWCTLMCDPETQYSSLSNIIRPGTYIAPHVLSDYSMTMLFIQFDKTLQPQNIIDAYFIVGMFPLSAGSAGFSKELGQPKTMERSIQMAGILQHNQNTRAVGVEIATQLGLHLIAPTFAQPVATMVDSGIQDMGLARDAAQDQNEFNPLSWGGNQKYPSGAVLGGVPLGEI
ncbi:MAG: hypothetical protein J6S85_23780 [Methanobrevibacter sp.]|nr:hypothetical protein [Methanobrevibacter sp.]